jgi:hypothetical protein
MNPKTLGIVLAISVAAGFRGSAQTYDANGDYVQTFVGSGLAGYLDGIGLATKFDNPQQMVADSSGNLFVYDFLNHVIRKITLGGTVSTFAGPSPFSGPGAGDVGGMAIDQNNTIWMTAIPYILYRITSNATVTAISVPLPRPQGVCVDSLGNLYLSDWTSNNIYRCSATGALTLFAGSGDAGYMNGNGVFTAFNQPMAMTADTVGNIYVWDSGNELIRKIDQSQDVSTYAGHYPFAGVADGSSGSAGFFDIYAMCFDTFGDLILACNTSVRQVTAGMNVDTLAGSFYNTGFSNGIGSIARFYGAVGVAVSARTIYIADDDNNVIRSITNNFTSPPTVAASLLLSTNAELTITGGIYQTYQIQSSPDLNSWTPQETVILTSNSFVWTDPVPATASRFYRAVSIP